MGNAKKHRPFWPCLHSNCLQVQNLKNFPVCLLRERRESKSSPGDTSLGRRTFRLPKERTGRGEGCSGREESLTTPILGWPSALTVPSPLWQGTSLFHIFSQAECTWKKRKRRTVRGNSNLLPIKGRVTLIYSSRTQSYHRFSILGKQLSSQLPTGPLEIEPTAGLIESRLTFYRVGFLISWKRKPWDFQLFKDAFLNC